MLRSLFVVSLAVMVVLCGCQASTKPKIVSATPAAPDAKLKVGKAPFNGEYRLFATRADSASGRAEVVGEPLASERLRRGEPVGFRREGGQVQAVAGAQSIPLETGRYAWQMRADAGQIDRTRTAALVVFAVAATALGLQIAFASPF